MNKKLMLLGLCLMGVFSSLHADESGEVPNETAAVIATSDTSISTPSEKEDKEKNNEDCGCSKKKG